MFLLLLHKLISFGISLDVQYQRTNGHVAHPRLPVLARDRQSLGNRKWVARNILLLWPIDISFNWILLNCVFIPWTVILYKFVHDFIHAHCPRARAENSLGNRFHLSNGQLRKVSKKVPWTVILYIFFLHDLIHVDSPGTKVDYTLGTEFWCLMKPFVAMANWCKFKKISLYCDFIWLYFMTSYLYIAPW